MFRRATKAISKANWSVFVGLAKLLRSLFGSVSTFRRIAFDSAEKGTLLPVRCGAENFVVSSDDRTIARYVYVKKKSFDFEKFEAAARLLPGGHRRKTLFDIGANIGTISISAVKRGIFEGAVAVEPDPLNFSLLKANIQLNGLADQFSTHNVAVGSESQGTVSFGLSEINHGDHRIVWDSNDALPMEEQRKQIEVSVMTLDEIADDFDADEAFVWMDIQGHEGHALSGASKLRKNGIPMCLEFWPHGLLHNDGYARLKKALTGGAWNTFIDLDDTLEHNALTAKSLDELFEKIGTAGPNTDILVFCK